MNRLLPAVPESINAVVRSAMFCLLWPSLFLTAYAQTVPVLQPTLATPVQDRLAVNAPNRAMASADPFARKKAGLPGPTNRPPKAGTGLPAGVKKLDGKAEEAMRKKAGKALEKAQSTLRFEQNRGQLGNAAVLYTAKDEQATHFFTKSEVRSVIAGKKDSLQAGYALQFLGANPDVAVTAANRFDAKNGAINYITSEGSFADVAAYRKIAYGGLWQGIDASFYESEGSMKYDFIVQPNADPTQVRLKLDGATNLKINAKGELEFTTPFGTLQKGKPYTYQTINGKQVEVAAAYRLNGGEISFQLGDYDHSLPLIIDPIALKWSTYLMPGTDFIWDIYVHPTTGRIYLAGQTATALFPKTLGSTFAGSYDATVTCLEKDGTALVWSTTFGGSEYDFAFALSVDAAGDVYVGGYTSSSNFPVNGTTAAYDATYNGGTDIFLLRLNSTGATLKYGTFIGGSGYDGDIWRKLVVTNGKVYFGTTASSTNFPTTAGVYQATKTSTADYQAVLVGVNTNVGGSAGLEVSTFFSAGAASNSGSNFTEIEEDKDGNLWLVGWATFDPAFPISANAVQKYADYNYPQTTDANFVAKFSKSGQYLYSSWVNPLWSPNTASTYEWMTKYLPSLDVDAQGNVYVAAGTRIYDVSAATVKKAPNIANYYELAPLSTMIRNTSQMEINYLAKIPYTLSPQYDFVTVFGGTQNGSYNEAEVAVDKKGNIHMLGQGSLNPAAYAFTAGAFNTNVIGSFSSAPTYYVLAPSGGSVLYSTLISSDNDPAYSGIFVNDKCEAYLPTGASPIYPVTPTYRDFETNTKKTVYNSTVSTGMGLAVFHEPIPNNNTIPAFAAGNNTFCVGGAIWQNPNDGPIIGSTAGYVSGDGSSATHNLPNTTLGAHPTPASPALQYQWQKSLNGGTTWTNVGNGTYDVYKPSPEPAAGTVRYRRTIVGFCCDTLSISNVISATIAGNFTLQISTPTKPVYYCPTVAGTSLSVVVTGASGNISWQWYDGFSPLTGTGVISPSSGTGTQASFAAAVGTSVSGSGFYRLVITDAGGCRKEAFVAIAPKTASAGPSPTMALCPGATISVKLGPTAINPDFDYSWTGPGGFVSTLANPVVSVAGTYTLRVKLKTDASFCAPGTTVVVTPSTPYDAALTSLVNKAFCQGDTPAAIGLTGTPPSGYVFQWVPGTNLDNQQAYSPVYDPGIVPGGPPIGTTNYTFTALRLSDGCIFESTNTVTNTALAFAFAGSNLVGDGCTNGKRDGVGGVETTGQYFQWTAIKTDFAAGLASLKANAAFGMDALGQQVGTNKFLNAKFPLCSVNGNVGYYIDYELKASYIPFSNGCFTSDTVRVFIPCCGTGPGCPILTSNLQGSTGACSGATTQLSFSPIQGATYTWTTYSINGVVQPAGTAPRGLFVNNNGVKGAPISATGPHSSSVIVDFDDATWGWLGNNVVVYQVTQGYGTDLCFSRQQVFSGLNGTPKIGVLDQALCAITTPGVRVGTVGNAAPFTLTGTSYTQAPNSAFDWSWTGGPITANANTPFPTVNPTATTSYTVTVRDAATGCVATDVLVVKVKGVVANAGPNLADICPGSLVQLGAFPAEAGTTYSWSPSAGLNFPIGTPNSTVAQPYLTVPGPAPATLTYTLNVTDTETGCQATDNVTIGVTSTAPPAITGASYSACANASFPVGPFSPLTGATYQWTVQGGTANLAWLSSTTVNRPTLTLPAGFSGPAVFRLTLTKGDCGSVFADFTINDGNPAIALGGPYTAACTAPFLQIGEAALTGYTYTWSPASGLYTNNTLTTAYTGFNLAQPWVLPTATTTYTVTRKDDVSGCVQTATVVVNPPAGVAVNAGPDKFWCPAAPAIPIGASGSGTLTWTAIAYIADLTAAVPTTIASPMTSAQMLGYLSSTSGASVNFVQSTVVSGQYVYRLTSTSGGCSVTDDVVVKVSPVLPTGIAGLGQNVCPGSSVQLGASTNPTTYNYRWTALNPSTAGSTINDATAARPFVTPTVTTTYQVVYTNALTGCSADELVTVVVNPKPNIADVSTATVCQPIAAQNLTSLVSGYGSLVNPVWYKTQYPGGVVVSTPTSVSISQTTTYFLVAENSFGCKDTAQVVVNVANPATPNIATAGLLDCTTRTFNLATVQGTPSVAGNTLEWHTANNTLASTLITNLTVGVGTYYLFEKAASPANCYSASAVVTVTSTCPVASLGDYVFEDVNANGIQEPTDKPIAGVTVTLLSSGTLVATTTTNASGLYSFTGLTPGVPYSVSFTAPAGFSATIQNIGSDVFDSDGLPATGLTGVYTLTANENNTTVDMGYYKPASLGDKVFVDANKNGIQDLGPGGGDTPIPGVIVTLISNGTVVATTTTLSSGTAIGCYSFTGLTPGKPYSVSFTTPAGYTATTPNAPGSTTATDSDPVNGITASVTLASGENNPTLDAGFYLSPAMSITLTSAPVCNSLTNNYTATATVSLTSASAGTLTITDNGTTIGTISVTAGQATATVSVTGVSDAASHTLLASFNSLTATTIYTAPVPCTVCSTSITTASLPNGQVGAAYSQTLTASGGTTPYTYAVSAGTLPAGLSLNPTTGEISGIPTSAVTSNFTVKVTDAKSCSDAQPLMITTSSAPVCSLTATATPTVCNTATNTYTVTGTVSATNTAINGAATQSLTISVGSSSTVVTLTGNGPVSYTLTGLDSDGLTHTVTVLSSATACGMTSVTYLAPASCTVCSTTLTSSSLPRGKVGNAYSATLIATNGTAPYSFSVSRGSLPTGLTLNPITGVISGTPTVSAPFPITIAITDASGCVVRVPLTVIQIDVADVCALSVQVTPGLCLSATNQYSISGTVSLTSAIAGTLTITDGALSTSVTVTASTTSVAYSLSGLSSGSGSHTVTASLSGCGLSNAIYMAPVSCSIGSPTYAISKVVDLKQVEKGQTVTYTLSVTNTSAVAVTNLVLTDQLNTTTFTPVGSATASAGSFVPDIYGGVWSLSLLTAGQVATLSYTVQLNAEGITYNTVTAPNGQTVTVCTTVPFRVCANELFEFELSVPDSFTAYQWSVNGQPIAGATTNTLSATALGEYTVTTNGLGGCSTGSCCPFIVGSVGPLPSLTAVTLAASCSNATPQADAQITLVGSNTVAVSYNITIGSSFTAATPLFTSPRALSSVVATLLLGGQPSPAVAQDYTIRVYSATGCFTDTVVTILPTLCNCPPPVCVPFVVKKTRAQGKPL